MGEIDTLNLKTQLWKAISEYADALAYVETFRAVHEVFADEEALDLKSSWEDVAAQKKHLVDRCIESILSNIPRVEKIEHKLVSLERRRR